MEIQLSDRVDYLLYVLTLCLVARIYNLTKFASRFHRTLCGNMYKVDHQTLSYVKILSKTRLLQFFLTGYRSRREDQSCESPADCNSGARSCLFDHKQGRLRREL